MFRKILEKMRKVQLDMDSIVQTVVEQNEDIQDYTERLLDEKISDEIMEQIIEQEVVQIIQWRIEEAFEWLGLIQFLRKKRKVFVS